MILFYIIYY